MLSQKLGYPIPVAVLSAVRTGLVTVRYMVSCICSTNNDGAPLCADCCTGLGVKWWLRSEMTVANCAYDLEGRDGHEQLNTQEYTITNWVTAWKERNTILCKYMT